MFLVRYTHNSDLLISELALVWEVSGLIHVIHARTGSPGIRLYREPPVSHACTHVNFHDRQ